MNVDEDVCTQCEHPFSLHPLIVTGNDPSTGGIVLCPAPGCQCLQTWGTDGKDPDRLPEEAQINAIRAKLQRRDA